MLVLAGCEHKGLNTAAVSGHVSYRGKPVTEGRITFYPVDGRAASGAIGPDGSYKLTTVREGDGALLGHHQVTIEARQVTGRPDYKGFAEEIRGVRKGDGTRFKTGIVLLVPDRYSHRESTPLTAEVKEGKNTINFNLPGEPGVPAP